MTKKKATKKMSPDDLEKAQDAWRERRNDLSERMRTARNELYALIDALNYLAHTETNLWRMADDEDHPNGRDLVERYFGGATYIDYDYPSPIERIKTQLHPSIDKAAAALATAVTEYEAWTEPFPNEDN